MPLPAEVPALALGFRALVESSEDIITVVGSDGRIVYDNPSVERVLGYAQGELVGRNAFELVHADDYGTAFDLFATTVGRAGATAALTVRFLARDGTWRYLETHGRSVGEGEAGVSCGGGTQVVLVSRDVTERVAHAAAEEAARAELEQRVRRQSWELDATHAEMLNRLAAAAECRDDDTGQHQHRVGALAAAVAGELGVPWRAVELVRRAAPLHDVGKIGIRDAILLKPGPLDPDELAVMRTHTVLGARILARGQSELVRTAEDIALCHHERWDGSGYPRGVAGEQIPLSARIVAVVDFFDALTHDRPYRPAFPPERALDDLRRERGAAFDPGAVAAFERVVERGEVC